MLIVYIVVKIMIWATLRQIERQGVEIDSLIASMQAKAREPVIEARLEEHQGEFFLYRVDNGEFIAQGATAGEIVERTDKRIRDRPVMVIEADDGVLERYRATKTVV
jgi:hypothetical protein